MSLRLLSMEHSSVSSGWHLSGTDATKGKHLLLSQGSCDILLLVSQMTA
jgi:hypothetical protein